MTAFTNTRHARHAYALGADLIDMADRPATCRIARFTDRAPGVIERAADGWSATCHGLTTPPCPTRADAVDTWARMATETPPAPARAA